MKDMLTIGIIHAIVSPVVNITIVFGPGELLFASRPFFRVLRVSSELGVDPSATSGDFYLVAGAKLSTVNQNAAPVDLL